LLDALNISQTLPSGKPDTGLIVGDSGGDVDAFISAVAMHRHYGREAEPPLV
jgi:catalase